MDLAVDAQAREPLRAKLRDQLVLLALRLATMGRGS